MLNEILIPISENSMYQCSFRRIPDTEQLHIADPKVIEKVESSGNYFLTYEDPVEIFSTDLPSLRNEMGSANKDLCTSTIEEIPYLADLPGRMIPITFFRIPNGEKQKAVIFIHGGGFIGGSTNVLRNQCRFLAEQSRATVVSIDYRLAPENPFPNGLNDCKNMIQWLADHASDWNIFSDNFIISGESAGGNLAVACSLSDMGKYIALTIPIYGALDLSKVHQINYWDYNKYTVIPEHKKYITTRLNRFRRLGAVIQDMYIPKCEDIRNPSISPLYAKDYSNLSKVIVIEAEYDFFRLSNDLFAEKLLNARIPCEVIRYQGMDHGFYDRLGYCQQTKDCILEIAKQIQEL